MREHKFRARNANRWIYGYFYVKNGKPHIINYDGDFLTIDGTDGEYIGLKDKNGTEIYSGDLLLAFGATIGVIFHNGAFGYIASRMAGFIPFCGHAHLDWNDGKCDIVEVVGNIFENPELIK